MSQQRFIRCPHCGLPHEAEQARCPVTGRALEIAAKPRRGPPPTDDHYSWEHSLHPWSRAEDAELDPQDLASFVGRVVEGKYRVDALIGRGGMGAVFRAENLRIGKVVALKVLSANYTPGSESERRFLREARLVGSMGHPNIVEVFDLGRLEDGKPFQVMELLEGQTLAERIRIEGALPEREALDIAEQVLSALEAAHDRGVVHRDLKPDNVYLVERGGTTTAKLLDFGVSKSLSEHTLSLTMPGVVVGTPYYLSPEQARGAQGVDHRVDIWSMGVLMYEVLTGVLPFNAKSYDELLAKILETRPVPPSRFAPRLTPAVEAVVLRALAFRPSERFGSASEMRSALRAARRTVGAATIEHRFPPYDLEGAGDVTVRQDFDDFGPDEPTEVSESFVASDLPIVIERADE
jgi:serine/threonine-protein kinase